VQSRDAGTRRAPQAGEGAAAAQGGQRHTRRRRHSWRYRTRRSPSGSHHPSATDIAGAGQRGTGRAFAVSRCLSTLHALQALTHSPAECIVLAALGPAEPLKASTHHSSDCKDVLVRAGWQACGSSVRLDSRVHARQEGGAAEPLPAGKPGDLPPTPWLCHPWTSVLCLIHRLGGSCCVFPPIFSPGLAVATPACGPSATTRGKADLRACPRAGDRDATAAGVHHL
jgi:hypothetical protein